MSRGNTSNDGNRNSESDNDEGWGSKLLKVASAAAAAATVVGGLYALMSSNNSEHQSPFKAQAAAAAEDDDEDDDETPSSKIWTKPEFGWQKLNVDGSLDHMGNPRSAGCGGVLRDASGTWLIGFAQKLDPSYDIHTIELEAILKGMELASDMNVKKLVVESDRKTAVSAVKKGLGNKIYDPPYNIINRIRKLLHDKKWEVKIVRIGRTANGVADRLAGDARYLPFEYMKKFHSPPLNCATLLQQDAQVGGVLGYY